MSSFDNEIAAWIQPKEYFRSCIEASDSTRANGRTFLEPNQINIKTDVITNSDASAMVFLGETISLCAVKTALLSAPSDTSRPIVANVSFCPGSAASVRPGPPSPTAQQMSTLVNRELNTCISQENLIEGDFHRVIYLDILVINDAGGVFSSVWMACVAALKTLYLPPIRADDTGVFHGVLEQGKVLVWNAIPIPLTVVYIPRKDAILLEPDYTEEIMLEEHQSNILLDANNSDHTILYYDGNNVPQHSLDSFIQSRQLRNYLDIIKSALKL